MPGIDMGDAAGNNAAPSTTTENGDSRFSVLERTLEQFQENARHMGVIASDFSPRSQEPLNQKVHTMISGLQELDRLKSQFHDIRIPLELLDYLDQGKNPQLYTRECLERTLQKNKEVNGKIEIYKKFHAALLKELSEEMPTDAMTYLNQRKTDSTPENCLFFLRRIYKMDK
jgi:mediator of RNA polymerase II transcription subunit 10